MKVKTVVLTSQNCTALPLLYLSLMKLGPHCCSISLDVFSPSFLMIFMTYTADIYVDISNKSAGDARTHAYMCSPLQKHRNRPTPVFMVRPYKTFSAFYCLNNLLAGHRRVTKHLSVTCSNTSSTQEKWVIRHHPSPFAIIKCFQCTAERKEGSVHQCSCFSYHVVYRLTGEMNTYISQRVFSCCRHFP